MKTALTILILVSLCAGPGWADSLIVVPTTQAYDAKILSNNATNNYGGATSFTTYTNGSDIRRSVVGFWNWDTISVLYPGATVDSAFYKPYVETENNATVYMWQLLKPLYSGADDYEGTSNGTLEGGAVNYNNWYEGDAGADSIWGKAGADSNAAGGVQNRKGLLANYQQLATDTAGVAVTGSTWTTTAVNSRTSNNIWARDGTSGHILNIHGYQFNIPTTSTVDSIKVTFEGYNSNASVREGMLLQLTKDSTNDAGYDWYFDLNASASADSTFTSLVATTGALWGTTWTPAEINDRGFGVKLTNSMTGNYCFVDWIGITVYFHPDYGVDRANTVMATQSITETGRARFQISNSLLSGLVAGTTWGGFLLVQDSTSGITIYTSKEGTAAQRPQWVIYYTPVLSNKARRRSMFMGGNE